MNDQHGSHASMGSFHQVMTKLESGDDDIAAVIFNRYSRRLISRVGQRMSRRAQTVVAPEDVVQSAFRTFFLRASSGQFEIDGWDSLLGLLVRITMRKCGRSVASLHAACRNIARDARPSDNDETDLTVLLASVTSPPDEEAVMTDLIEHLNGELSERDQQIVAMRLEGYRVHEVSEAVGCTERTVHRALTRVRTRLEAMDEN